MQLWGRHRNNKRRFRCTSCRKGDTASRVDIQKRAQYHAVRQWLTGTSTAHTSACTTRVTSRTLRRWADRMKAGESIPLGFFSVVVLDVMWIGAVTCVCIARDPTRTPGIIGWVYGSGETVELYERLTSHIYGAIYIVDGHASALGAILRLHPHSPIQRCLVHVQRQIRIRLTSCPKTVYGKQLLTLVKDLWGICTKRQKRRWIRRYRTWRRRSWSFLAEKTFTKDTLGKARWWYTHKNLRRARTHLNRAFPHLFTYLKDKAHIPRHTNHVEGGVNSRLTELIFRHRGLSARNILLLTSLFLTEISLRKPTQNVH